MRNVLTLRPCGLRVGLRQPLAKALGVNKEAGALVLLFAPALKRDSAGLTASCAMVHRRYGGRDLLRAEASGQAG